MLDVFIALLLKTERGSAVFVRQSAVRWFESEDPNHPQSENLYQGPRGVTAAKKQAAGFTSRNNKSVMV